MCSVLIKINGCLVLNKPLKLHMTNSKYYQLDEWWTGPAWRYLEQVLQQSLRPCERRTRERGGGGRHATAGSDDQTHPDRTTVAECCCARTQRRTDHRCQLELSEDQPSTAQTLLHCHSVHCLPINKGSQIKRQNVGLQIVHKKKCCTRTP